MFEDRRPHIPEPVLRNVRQRCGFGCVVCGSPIVEYDHMEPFADVQEHDEANLTCLCPQHHREKTNNLLPIEEVRRYNKHPYNVERGVTSPYELHFGATPIEFELGNCLRFRSSTEDGRFVPIMVDDVALLGFQEIDGEFGLWVQDFNEYNVPILGIEHNVLYAGLNNWDTRFQGNRLVIRSGPGQVKIAIQFEPPSRVVILRAQMKYDGVTVDVRPNAVRINGFLLSGFTVEASEVGIRVGPPINLPPTNSLYLTANRYDPTEVAGLILPGPEEQT